MPQRTFSKAPSRRVPLVRSLAAGLCALVVLATLFVAPGCDNPACVFGGDCNGGSVGIGSNPATIPTDGTWINPEPPMVEAMFPSGTNVDRNTPIVIVFSESIAPSNLNAAFELSIDTPGGNPQALPFGITSLIGDGRVLVLLPATPLLASSQFSVRFRAGFSVADLTGQTVTVPANRLVGSFSTGATQPAAPKLLMSYPADNATGQSATGEIVTVFTRPLNEMTITDMSFVVEFDGGPPPFPTEPAHLSVAAGMLSDSRVFRYRVLDTQNQPAPLPNSTLVHVSLSPVTDPITDDVTPTANELAPVQFDFHIGAFGAPGSAALTSIPTDAIGIDQITGPANLALEVDSPDAQSGDRLLITIFGTKVTTDANPPLIALQRDVALASPFTTFTLTAPELDLVDSTSPLRGRVADGSIGFAFQLKRGGILSPVRVLDLDLNAAGTQSPVLDTVAPTLTSPANMGAFTSDLRDLAIVGTASEQLRAALVTTVGSGDNDVNSDGVPPVAGSVTVTGPGSPPSQSAVFVARPVPLGIASGPVPFSVSIYDRALNFGGTATGTFFQVGASGPGNPLPGAGTVAVDVFDETTLAPIAGASVSTHTNFAGIVTALASGTTDSAGVASIAAAAAGETIVTVVATGYDVFTFDGVPTDHLSVPLRPTNLAQGSASGLVASTLTLSAFRRDFTDSRTPDDVDRVFNVGNCTFDNTQSRNECPFGPVNIAAREIGAQSALSIVVPPNFAAFSALLFLPTFRLHLPSPAASAGAATVSEIEVTTLLAASETDAEERAIEAPPVVLSNVNFPSLTVSRARVTIEARASGVRGTAVVGEGLAFDVGTSPNFAVRSAYAGVADGTVDAVGDGLGRLVKDGSIDGDLFLRCEWSAPDGSRGGRRPRLSTNPTTLTPPAPALLDATTPIDVNLGLDALDLMFSDVLPDSIGQPGLYRTVLTNSAGRRWIIWSHDIDDASGPDMIAHLPLVGGAVPIGAGPLQCRISAYAWPSLDPASLMWTDVEREFDYVSHSVAQTVTPP